MTKIKWENNPQVNLANGVSGNYVDSKNNTFGLVKIAKDAQVPWHNHPQEQFTLILKGQLELQTRNETIILKPNEAVVIDSFEEHRAWAIEECLVLDVFYPLRQFLNR